jgi:hypothetical protein
VIREGRTPFDLTLPFCAQMRPRKRCPTNHLLIRKSVRQAARIVARLALYPQGPL